MAKDKERNEPSRPGKPQQEGQQDRSAGRQPAQGGTGDRQQGGGGQVTRTDKPGQRAGRMRNGGQDSH
ncbi:MAG TPA: hypothetical protein VFX69_09625 [Steroidobacteraceae bacterium]|nr:hypothetical protein [Steroidobacteraceae bacterium]